jgi:hypothetical protein
MSTEDLSKIANETGIGPEVDLSNVSLVSGDDWPGWSSQERLNVSLNNANENTNKQESEVNLEPMAKETEKVVGPSSTNSNEEFQNRLMNMLQSMNDNINNKFEKVYERIDGIEAKLEQTNAKLDREVIKVHDRVDKTKAKLKETDSELLKLSTKTVALETALKNNETKINEVEKQAELDRSENKSRIDECVKKQDQFEHRYDQEAIVVTNRIQSLELDSKSVENKLDKVVAEVSGLRQNKQPTVIVSQEFISANAELFLTRFDNEQNSVHPMTYLKFAKKFVEVSGNNWEVQLLYLIKYLHGEPGIWARSCVDRFDSFVRFESEFKRKYWGNTRQREFECELMGWGNYRTSNVDLQTYIMTHYEINKMLDKPISMEMFLKHICRHLPESSAAAIQMIMTVKEIKTEIELEAMCRNLGVIHDRESLPTSHSSYTYKADSYEKNRNDVGLGYKQNSARTNTNQNNPIVESKMKVNDTPISDNDRSDVGGENNQEDSRSTDYTNNRGNYRGRYNNRGNYRGISNYRGNNNRGGNNSRPNSDN